MRLGTCLFCTLASFIFFPAPGGIVLADDPAPIDPSWLDARSLYLRTGTIDLRDVPSILESTETFEQAARYVIQLDGPITPARRKKLIEAGVVLHEYLPLYAYVADLSGTDANSLRGLGFVAWVGEFEKAWKLCPMIGAHAFETAQRKALAARGVGRLVVRLFEDSDTDEAAERIAGCGATPRGMQVRAGACQMEIEMPAGRIAELKALPGIMFVEEAAEAHPRNASTAWITQSNVTNSTPVWDKGLLGQNQIAGLIDWNMSTTHCALSDPANPIGPNHRKILAYYDSGSESSFADHGTHVGAVLAGNDPANTTPAFRGIAPECKLVFTNQPTEINSSNLYDRLELHHADGARVHNNSWGSAARDYIAWARDIDAFTRDFEDDLVLVAVTNFNVQVQSPENAKNVLAVAATEDAPDQGARCWGGFGPTLDGRQKPEVWAVGCASVSANAATACGTREADGTSFAAPVVTAMGILTRQYFMEGFHPGGAANANDAFTPSGALLKAMIINSAVDMSGITGYFTVNEGWGRILMDDVLFFAGDERKLVLEDVRNEAGLSTGEAEALSIDVLSDSEPLKITLVWSDVPAALMAAFTPVNDLDLVVTDPNGDVYLGNVFVDGQSATGGEADAVNNAEQVHRLLPAVGTWTIRVSGTAVNQGAQGYALVATGDILHGGEGPDCNANGTPDDVDIADQTSPDCNENGIPDECDVDPADPDGDGMTSDDCNVDGVPDECEGPSGDCNENGVPDACDISDGVSPDCNENGIPDECDVDPADPDGDGETSDDCDENGIPDECGTLEDDGSDCNDNGRPDNCDLSEGVSLDCNENAIPDECDVDPADPDGDGETSDDCDEDGVPDECDGASADCNENGVPDACDISAATSPDCNDNGAPDECDLADGLSDDCDGNDVPDECDMADGTATDCDADGRMDACELADSSEEDCNRNGVHDACELADGLAADCNDNDVPDDCELDDGLIADCNGNGLPDECDLDDGASVDCNANDVPDECELDDGQALDCNENGRPDECDLDDGTSADANADGIPDECQEDETPAPQDPGDDDGENGIDRDMLRTMLASAFNIPGNGHEILETLPVRTLGILGLGMTLRLLFVGSFDLPARWIMYEWTYRLFDMMLP